MIVIMSLQKEEPENMEKKVTIQDIADALNLSRNTVSKAINNSPGIADATRTMILEKAVEMGYKQFSYVRDMMDSTLSGYDFSLSDSRQPKEIALFTVYGSINNSHFASLMLDKFTDEISQLGFSLITYRLSEEDIRKRALPRTFLKEHTCAIMCIEIFDREYSDLICSLDLPVLFVDCAPFKYGRGANADVLLMENNAGIMQFIDQMTARGCTRFGFVGDYNHCQSFYERYNAYRIGMLNHGLLLNPKFEICPDDKDFNMVVHLIENLDEFPEVFICVNDFIAIDTMLVLRSLGKQIPQDIKVLGFDDSQESRVFSPTLSTVHIHTQSMAFSALRLLLSRMKEPTLAIRTMHIAADLILRESTEG